MQLGCNTHLTTSLSHQLQVGVSHITYDSIMITIINQSTTYAEAMATTCAWTAVMLLHVITNYKLLEFTVRSHVLHQLTNGF